MASSGACSRGMASWWNEKGEFLGENWWRSKLKRKKSASVESDEDDDLSEEDKETVVLQRPVHHDTLFPMRNRSWAFSTLESNSEEDVFPPHVQDAKASKMSSSPPRLPVSSSSTVVNTTAVVNGVVSDSDADTIDCYIPRDCTTCGCKHDSTAHFFQYVSEDSLHEEMKDPVTLEPFVDPVVLRSDTCEHTFSRSSIEDAINSKGCCPIDMSPLTLDDIMSAPLLVKNLLNSMPVCCPNAGCAKVLKRGVLDKHLAECPETELVCRRVAEGRACDAVVRRRDVAAHDLECGSRLVKCEVEGGCELMVAVSGLAGHDCVQALKKRVLELEDEVRARKTCHREDEVVARAVAGEAGGGAGVGTSRLLRSWGREGKGDGDFQGVLGVTVCSRTNEVYTLDIAAHRVQVFDEAGNFLRKWGKRGTGYGLFVTPTGIELSPEGEVFVVDTGNNRVQVFDKTGKFLRKFGKKGSSPGALNSPCTIAISSNGEVYVTDSQNDRIQVFDLEGRFLRLWNIPGDEHSLNSFPQSIAVSSRDEVYVGVSTFHRIQVFDRLGNPLRQFGPCGQGQGELGDPCEIAISGRRDVCVTENIRNTVSVFDSAGTFLREFGGEGEEDDKLGGPCDMAFCSRTGHVYVADINKHRIKVFSFYDT